jgi:hypothetical protein
MNKRNKWTCIQRARQNPEKAELRDQAIGRATQMSIARNRGTMRMFCGVTDASLAVTRLDQVMGVDSLVDYLCPVRSEKRHPFCKRDTGGGDCSVRQRSFVLGRLTVAILMNQLKGPQIESHSHMGSGALQQLETG